MDFPIGLFAFNLINNEVIKSSSSFNFLNLFVTNGTKNIFRLQLLSGLVILVLNGVYLNNQIEEKYPSSYNNDIKENPQVDSKVNNSESENDNQSLTKPDENNSSSSSTSEDEVYHCVVCGKICESVYHENIYMGHHVEIGGIASSDVVCGLNCDLMLRKRNEAIINREMREGAMRRQGYTQGEINQMRDPNGGD